MMAEVYIFINKFIAKEMKMYLFKILDIYFKGRIFLHYLIELLLMFSIMIMFTKITFENYILQNKINDIAIAFISVITITLTFSALAYSHLNTVKENEIRKIQITTIANHFFLSAIDFIFGFFLLLFSKFLSNFTNFMGYRLIKAIVIMIAMYLIVEGFYFAFNSIHSLRLILQIDKISFLDKKLFSNGYLNDKK